MGAPLALGLSAISGVLGVASQVSAQNQAYAGQKARHKQDMMKAQALRQQAEYEAKVRADEAMLNYMQLNNKIEEANISAANEKTKIKREAARERARLLTSAGESGIAGVSVDRILRGVGMDASLDIATIEANRESQLRQADMEKEGAKLRAKTAPVQTYVGSAPTKPSSGLVIATGLANTGMNMANTWNRYKK